MEQEIDFQIMISYPTLEYLDIFDTFFLTVTCRDFMDGEQYLPRAGHVSFH